MQRFCCSFRPCPCSPQLLLPIRVEPLPVPRHPPYRGRQGQRTACFRLTAHGLPIPSSIIHREIESENPRDRPIVPARAQINTANADAHVSFPATSVGKPRLALLHQGHRIDTRNAVRTAQPSTCDGVHPESRGHHDQKFSTSNPHHHQAGCPRNSPTGPRDTQPRICTQGVAPTTRSPQRATRECGSVPGRSLKTSPRG